MHRRLVKPIPAAVNWFSDRLPGGERLYGYLIYTPFTPIKVNYPVSDKSALRDAGCFFFGLAEKNFGLVAIKVANKVVKRKV